VVMFTGEMALVMFAGMTDSFVAVMMFTKARRIRRRDG